MNWLSPLLCKNESLRRKWRESQRRHRAGVSMTRKAAAREANKRRSA